MSAFLCLPTFELPISLSRMRSRMNFRLALVNYLAKNMTPNPYVYSFFENARQSGIKQFHAMRIFFDGGHFSLAFPITSDTHTQTQIVNEPVWNACQMQKYTVLANLRRHFREAKLFKFSAHLTKRDSLIFVCVFVFVRSLVDSFNDSFLVGLNSMLLIQFYAKEM